MKVMSRLLTCTAAIAICVSMSPAWAGDIDESEVIVVAQANRSGTVLEWLFGSSSSNEYSPLSAPSDEDDDEDDD